MIGTVWPEPGSSAAGSRTLQLIEQFQKQDWKITFACAATDSVFMIDLKPLDVEKVTIELNSKSFDEFIKTLQPTIVLFDRFMIEEQFGWRVAENCPNALRILDTVDLHCLRLARQVAVKEKREFNNKDLFSDVAKREIASIYRSDLTLMISSYEMDLLQNFFNISPKLLHYTPFLLDPIEDLDLQAWPSFEERNNFVTIGNFLHEPNWDAVQFLKEKIWPLVRKKLTDAELHIYGAYPSQKVEQLHQPREGFMIKGRAGSAHEVMLNAKVCLAPLRFGAGLKGKLIDAMQCGTPSVTTTIGAEGMHDEFEWSGIIADDVDVFVNAAVSLYTDNGAWMHAQKQGTKIIDKVFNKQMYATLLLNRLQSLQKNIEEHRHVNFTGAMLMHHTISGTKYMSRWIEEKNKKYL